MIIYGSKSKELTQQTVSEKCPSCGTQNSVAMHVFQRYAHVFWIPFFPIGKIGVSQCSHCKQALRTKEMPPALKAEYEILKEQTKTPLWAFTGAALLALLLVFVVVDENRKSAASAQYIKHLQPNDLLATKTEEGYTYLKVTEIKGDTVYLKSNKQVATLETGLDKLGTAESAFDEDEFFTTQQAIADKFNKKEILNVIRR